MIFNYRKSLLFEPEWFKLYRDSDESQMKSAIHHGATKEEILHTLGVVYVTAGAPGVNVCKNAIRKLLKVDFGCEGCGKV